MSEHDIVSFPSPVFRRLCCPGGAFVQSLFVISMRFLTGVNSHFFLPISKSSMKTYLPVITFARQKS